MAEFLAFEPGVEVNGETVLAVVEGMGAFADFGRQILSENGIVDPSPGRWYPQQAWLDAFKAIAGKVGPATLKMIGMKIPNNAQWPPGITTVEEALASIDVAYHMNHRGGEIGCYRFESTGPRSGTMYCRNPYPSDFDLGIILAVAGKFAPKWAVNVVLDPNAPTRWKGGDSCTYIVTW